jgi:DNA-directed RNA polymerase specialized sigma24 family protein
MRLCQEDLDKFRSADRAYQDALRETDTLKRVRDEILLELADKSTVRDVAAATGLSPGRVHQIVTRARNQA